jgi:aryl-alcohol dehydrogenase-like predicted oxidoreductase
MTTDRRSEIFLATKFGAFDPDRSASATSAISKPSYIRKALSRSLRLLNTNYIDLYYQHRVDPDVPVEVVMEVLREPVETGVIKWIGLSECSADYVRRARSVPGIGKKVIACQVEYSPFELYIEKNGLARFCEEEGVAIVPYSPLGRGLVSGR